MRKGGIIVKFIVYDGSQGYAIGTANTLEEARKIGEANGLSDYFIEDELGYTVFDEDEVGFTIECGCHIYVTLRWNGHFIFCYDNDGHYMEYIIEAIEKRTKMKFKDIPVRGRREDFNGLRYLNGGFKTAEQIFA